MSKPSGLSSLSIYALHFLKLTKTNLPSNIYRGINESIVLDVNNVVHYKITALKKSKLKCILVQALRLCTGRTAQ
jgi:hypothetical protein